MASSQVEFASSSPFGCVLKDHNRRDRCRDSTSNSNIKSQSNFQRNLKELVRDHLHSCMSISPRSSDLMSNENHRHQRENFNCWGCNNSRNGSSSSSNYKNPNLNVSKSGDDEHQMSSRSRRQSRVPDRWAARQARETITTNEKQNHEAEILALSHSHSVSSMASSPVRDSSPAPSDSSADTSVSSLVQKWRGLVEAKCDNMSSNQNQNQNQNQSDGITGGMTSSRSSTEICSSVEASETTGDGFGLLSSGNGRPSLSSNNENDSLADSESEKIGPSDQVSLTENGGGGHVSDGERERITVADIIKKWTRVTKSRTAISRDEKETQQQHHHHHQQQQQQQPPPPMVKPSLARLQIGEQGGEQWVFHPVLCSPRLRGRQAIADLYMRLERERHKEIEGLAARQAVSKFPQRGRIQSVLRLRFLRHGALVENQREQQSRTCELNPSQHSSTITSLRERFSNASEQDSAGMKNSEKLRTSKQDSISLKGADRSNATSKQDSASIRSLERCRIAASAQNSGSIESSERCSAAAVQDSTDTRTAARSNATSKQDCANIRSLERLCIAPSAQNSGNIRIPESCSAAAQDSTDMRNAERSNATTSEQDSAMMGNSEKCCIAPNYGNIKSSERCSAAAVQNSTDTRSAERLSGTSEQRTVKLRSLERHKILAASGQDSADMRSTERLGATTDQDSTSMRSPARCVVASEHDSTNVKIEESLSQASEQDTAKMRSIERCIEQDSTNVRTPPRDMLDDNLDKEKSSTSNQSSEETFRQEENNFEQPNITTQVENSLWPITEDLQEEIIPSADIMLQEAGFATVNLDSQETAAYITTSCHQLEEDLTYEEEDVSNQQYFEANLDWIYDISRPRNYWEDRRQAWYQEIFESTSTNEEIRQLIERRSVSAALSSAFRARMDRLMSCHARQMYPLYGDDEDLFMGTSTQRNVQPSGNDEEQQDLQQPHQLEHEELEQEEEVENDPANGEEEEEEDEQEDDEEQSPSLNPCQDVRGYFQQTPSSSQLHWRHYQEDHYVSDYSDQVTSTPFQQTSVFHSSDHDIQEGCSFRNVSSIEMELIYDLRAQMEQLFGEMSELRKSMNGCVDMQAMVQSYVREEVAAALGRSDQKEKKERSRKTPKKGGCCICYAKKVDSLLYRCGHMCTCFKCAQDLQQSTGKCPICRAQILDVVRAYTDT
ncbi:hypothetical protein Ancab_019156 [Ancistrocladus abbreviatus]